MTTCKITQNDFLWAVATSLQNLGLTHNAEFQEFCANAYGLLSVEQAAESWEQR